MSVILDLWKYIQFRQFVTIYYVKKRHNHTLACMRLPWISWFIGAIFPSAKSTEEGALRFAVDQINGDPFVLPNYHIQYIGNYTDSLLADFQNIQKGDFCLRHIADTIQDIYIYSSRKCSSLWHRGVWYVFLHLIMFSKKIGRHFLC